MMAEKIKWGEGMDNKNGKPARVNQKITVDRYAHQESERWHRLGATVVDCMGLLEHMARIKPHSSAYDEKHFQAAQRTAMLVARHALDSVLTELNNEHMAWHFVDPVRRAKEAADIRDYLEDQHLGAWQQGDKTNG
jgi:hypothetical protein